MEPGTSPWDSIIEHSLTANKSPGFVQSNGMAPACELGYKDSIYNNEHKDAVPASQNGEKVLSPSLHNGHVISTRQYSCKACFFSTSTLLQFLLHVEKMHYDCHTSKSDASLRCETEKTEFSEYIATETKGPKAHITGALDVTEEKTNREVSSNPVKELPEICDDKSTLVTRESGNIEFQIKREFGSDEEVRMSSPAAVTATAPTCKPDDQIALPDVPIQCDPALPSNALVSLQNITNSVLPVSRVNLEKEIAVIEGGSSEVSAEMPRGNSHRSSQPRSRGIKIDSIANSLKECNTSKPYPKNPWCNVCGGFLNPNSAECQNCAQIHSTQGMQPSHPYHFSSGSMAQSFPYRQTCLPKSKPSISPRYSLLSATTGHLKRLYSHEDHFRNLQSLLSSGSVTMPHTPILQSIKCERESWRGIQETLHQAFSSFPYLTPQETLMLANMTGLTVQQVKTLFVVARLQHGISWDQEEIKNSRKYLGIPRNRFESCFPR